MPIDFLYRSTRITTISIMKKLYQLIQKNFLPKKVNNLLIHGFSGEQHPIITISREMGSGGRPIADLTAKALGNPWKVFHKEIVEEMSIKTNLEKELIKEVDENNIPMIDEIIADVFGKRYMTLNNYHKQLVRILSTIGNRGYAIIVGRGAHNMFPHALKIRIICEFHQRVAYEMEYEGISKQEAIKRIQESDRKRSEFERILFDHDWKKAKHFDIVIRTGSNMSIQDASDIVILAAKKRFDL